MQRSIRCVWLRIGLNIRKGALLIWCPKLQQEHFVYKDEGLVVCEIASFISKWGKWLRSKRSPIKSLLRASIRSYAIWPALMKAHFIWYLCKKLSSYLMIYLVTNSRSWMQFCFPCEESHVMRIIFSLTTEIRSQADAWKCEIFLFWAGSWTVMRQVLCIHIYRSYSFLVITWYCSLWSATGNTGLHWTVSNAVSEHAAADTLRYNLQKP